MLSSKWGKVRSSQSKRKKINDTVGLSGFLLRLSFHGSGRRNKNETKKDCIPCLKNKLRSHSVSLES